MKQAVLVIDFQQELVDGNTEERPVYLKEQVAHVIEAVVLEADERNIPVVFIRDLDVAGGTGPGFAVHDSIPVPASRLIKQRRMRFMVPHCSIIYAKHRLNI